MNPPDSPDSPVPENSPAVDVPCRGDRPSVREDAGGPGMLRRGKHPRSLHQTRSVLARAIRLMVVHTRCTCTQPNGHTTTCARLLSLEVLADAEKLGVDLSYDLLPGEHKPAPVERPARRAVRALYKGA